MMRVKTKRKKSIEYLSILKISKNIPIIILPSELSFLFLLEFSLQLPINGEFWGSLRINLLRLFFIAIGSIAKQNKRLQKNRDMKNQRTCT